MAEFDPVSDFLSREQEALGELGPEITLNAQHVPDVFASSEPTEAQDSGEFVFLNGEPKQSNTPSPQPPFGSASDQPSTGPDYQVESNLFAMNGNTESVFTASPEPNETWRQAFNERVTEKDAKEQESIAELKESGQKELENWYKHYQSQLQTRARKLRETDRSENENGELHNCDNKPGVTDKEVWEKICDMCDFQAKQKSAPDMARMRSILLSLKPSS